ncbi:hypothetical protein [Streptomyces sp. NBC_00424]|uniref:hypothetical protein n=1 Tax=Streptomyces sp. NBC_00424 TaxID=2903648 RepID=UPI002B1E2D50|nr:hypothetical protein [Streptomyces sp. NBC_00424]
MIIAASFSKQVTHTVVWLSEMNLDIDLIEVGLWKVQGQLVAGFTKVYPTPEVEEFTLAPARIEAKAATQKLEERSRARNAVHILVDAGLLPDGARLRLVPRHGVTESIREAIYAWVGEDSRFPRRSHTNPRHIVAYTDGEIRQQYENTYLGRPVGGEPTINDEADGVRFVQPTDLDQYDIHASMR